MRMVKGGDCLDKVMMRIWKGRRNGEGHGWLFEVWTRTGPGVSGLVFFPVVIVPIFSMVFPPRHIHSGICDVPPCHAISSSPFSLAVRHKEGST